MSSPRIAIIHSRLRLEEKLLVAAFQDLGVQPELIDDGSLMLNPLAPQPHWDAFDLVLQRSLSASRALAMLQVLHAWGIPALNNYVTSAICADKLATSLALFQAGIPQPDLRLAFTQEASLEAIEELGYPAVIKPRVGSWGRLLARVDSRIAAESVLEHRYTLGGVHHHASYLQAYVPKPGGRDVRAFVLGTRVLCAIYRTSDHWITNTARGAVASNCPIYPQLEHLCLCSAQAVGGGILAIDLFETDQGLLVNEVNHGMEFRNSMEPTGVDIPAEVARFVLSTVEESQQLQEQAL